MDTIVETAERKLRNYAERVWSKNLPRKRGLKAGQTGRFVRSIHKLLNYSFPVFFAMIIRGDFRL